MKLGDDEISNLGLVIAAGVIVWATDDISEPIT
jgi:hypothetical protein